MPFALFLDLLHGLGLTPPTEEYPGWGGWWETLREDQRSRLWEAFDRLRFYEVIVRPALPLGYAVLELNWTKDGVGMRWLSDEGGVIRGVYRNREGADGCYFSHFDGVRGRWLPADEDPFDPETHWRAYVRPRKHDIVQVDLGGGLRRPSAKKERKIYLVVRRIWEAGNDAPQPLEKERVPVCGFSDRKSAEQRRADLEATIPEQHDLGDLFSGWFDDNDKTDEFFEVVEPLNLPAPDMNVPKWWFENRGEIKSDNAWRCGNYSRNVEFTRSSSPRCTNDEVPSPTARGAPP